ncbi:heterokaryon incompatibility protein-domain-containing protein [Hypomontagnella monticulosa]|nr:heterokaryon incompatibility protein-domain-containing protein [Hypomontagnella monticulosa]
MTDVYITQEEHSSALCSNCRNVFNLEDTYWKDCVWMKKGLHSTFDQLVEAKDNSCHLCYILWHDFTAKLGSEATGPIEYFLEWTEPGLYTGFEMNGLIRMMHWSRREGRPFPQQSGSIENSRTEAVLAWVAEQLESCSHEHSECQRREVPPLPDRVLDIASTKRDIVRLVNTRSGNYVGGYSTLSHRWGDQKFLTLTTRNESSLEEGIPTSSLPQTFQDAIEVTKSVGLRYLWIDSLCIQQDSESDWREQSAKMGSIYRNCHFNIAATAASSDGVGLFVSQNPLSFLPVYVKIDTSFLTSGPEEAEALQRGETIQTIKTPTMEMFRSEDRGRDEYSMTTWRTVLHHRAWVFQERLLSPRVLNFGNGGIAWECWEKVALEHNNLLPNESISHEENESLRKFRDTKIFSRWLENLSQKIAEFPESRIGLTQEAYRRWQDAIEIYSRTSLTFPKDKLIALSGLASLVQKSIKDEYLAGLWRGNLPNDLLWTVKLGESSIRGQIEPVLCFRGIGGAAAWPTIDVSDPFLGASTSTHKEKHWRAPTWSWAHLDTPIYYESDSLDHEMTSSEFCDGAVSNILIRLLNSRIIPVGRDLCGQVEMAQLTVSGCLHKIEACRGGSIVQVESNRWWNVHPDTIVIKEKLEWLECNFVILLVLQRRSRCRGLLLEPDSPKTQYRRAGVVWCDIPCYPPHSDQEEIRYHRITLI